MPMFNNEGLGAITEGCKTTHGGYVLPISRPFTVDERAIALIGDMTHCPKCKGDFPITSGDPTRTWHDKGMAFHGDQTGCGAQLISEHPHQNPALAAALLAENNPQQSSDAAYDQHFLLEDENTGQPVAHRFYRLTLNGKTIEGQTDEHGKTEKVFAERPDEVTIEVMPEGYTGVAQ
jgi:uncharacterized Zn-binding protein involved in type VI secretion